MASGPALEPDPSRPDPSALRDALGEMGGLAERQVALAVRAATGGDGEAGRTAIEADPALDAAEAAIETIIAAMLARGPDMEAARAAIAALRIAAALERIGDYAANIAKRAGKLGAVGAETPLNGLRAMGRLVQDSLRLALDALAENDPDKAAGVWRADRAVDEIHVGLVREILAGMQDDRREIAGRAHLLFIAKNLERIGDHATTVAECAHRLATGRALPAARPKGPGGASV